MNLLDFPNLKELSKIYSAIKKEVVFNRIKYDFAENNEQEYVEFEKDIVVDKWTIWIAGYISWSHNKIINEISTDKGICYVDDSYIDNQKVVIEKITIVDDDDKEFTIR